MGNRIQFWQDRWCSEVPLASMFPMIYAIATDGEDVVASVVVRQGQLFVWNVHLRHDVQD